MQGHDENSPPQEEEEWQELMGSDLVMKKLTRCPDAVSVQAQDAVVVDFLGSYAPSRHDDDCDSATADARPIFHTAQNWLVVIGEKDVVPALELGIRFMNVGETAVIWSHSKYAYGPVQRRQGDYSLPPYANVRYLVTVKSIEDQDEPGFLLRASISKKDIGNDVFQNEWDTNNTIQGKSKAIQLYKRGADNLQLLLQNAAASEASSSNLSAAHVQQAHDIMVDCLNNIVATHLRAKEYHQAKQAAIRVLTVAPDNTKALLRAAKAALLDGASSYEEVQAALDAATAGAAQGGGSSSDDVNNKELIKLQQEFHRRKKEYKQRTKIIMAKMSKAIASESSSSNEATEQKETSKEAIGGHLESDESAIGPPVDKVESIDETPSTTTKVIDAEDASSENRVSFDWNKLFFSFVSQLFLVALVYAFTRWFKPNLVVQQQQTHPNSDTSSSEF